MKTCKHMNTKTDIFTGIQTCQNCKRVRQLRWGEKQGKFRKVA